MDGGAYAVLFNLVPRGKVETTLVLGMKTEAFMLITPISFVFVSGDVLLWVEKFFFFTALSGVVCSIAVLYVVTQRNAMVLPTMLL